MEPRHVLAMQMSPACMYFTQFDKIAPARVTIDVDCGAPRVEAVVHARVVIRTQFSRQDGAHRVNIGVVEGLRS